MQLTDIKEMVKRASENFDMSLAELIAMPERDDAKYASYMG